MKKKNKTTNAKKRDDPVPPEHDNDDEEQGVAMQGNTSEQDETQPIETQPQILNVTRREIPADVLKQMQDAQPSLEKAINDADKDSNPLKHAVNKVKIKLGRMGHIVAEIEFWVWGHFKNKDGMSLNDTLTEDEIAQQRAETTEDVNVMLNNRFEVLSKYGDIVNVGFTLTEHAAVRLARAAQKQFARRTEPNMAQHGSQQRTSTNGDDFDYGLTPDDYHQIYK